MDVLPTRVDSLMHIANRMLPNPKMASPELRDSNPTCPVNRRLAIEILRLLWAAPHKLHIVHAQPWQRWIAWVVRAHGASGSAQRPSGFSMNESHPNEKERVPTGQLQRISSKGLKQALVQPVMRMKGSP